MKIQEVENKKILIIVPHQDDEIHIAGSFIASLKNTKEVYVLYTTNGDFLFEAKYRYKEAIKSLNRLGKVPKQNVFFLGYSDQAYDQKSHMYNSDENWTSNKGHKETYAPKGYKEWNYDRYGVHCAFCKENVTRNIKEVIEHVKADVIICVDLDFHPDHIMTSLCFERAMGEILNSKDNTYYPMVLKTFAYENSYFGIKDFNTQQNNGMKFDFDKNGTLKSNPYYRKDTALILSIDKKCYTKNLLRNIIYKAIKCHKSQVLVQHTDSMINADTVYWKRNTRNLLHQSHLSVSSGNVNYLRDFIMADTSDVLNGDKKKIQFENGIWIPTKEDDKKEIEIEFDKEEYVSVINIYNGRHNTNFVKNIEIKYNDKKKAVILQEPYINIININEKTNKIIIKILDSNVTNGFSEIELLEKVEKDIKEEKEYDNEKHSKIWIMCNKLLIKNEIILQKVYRKIFIR